MEPLREIRNRLLNGWQLSKMHTFEVAARHQSFALAAEELSLSPSAVSHRINQLEEELGIQLFVRSHRKVELTHEGKRVYWALKSSLDTLNQEILDIKNQELSGTLTLYSRPSIAQCWLVPALGDFTRRYFEVNVHGQFGGIVYYQEIQPLTFDCHAMYLPEIRGFSKEIGLAFWRYILTNTTVQCVTSFAARKFRHGQIYCAMIGLKRVGTIKKYFKGVDDVTFYSATREELIDFLNHGR